MSDDLDFQMIVLASLSDKELYSFYENGSLFLDPDTRQLCDMAFGYWKQDCLDAILEIEIKRRREKK